MGRPAPRSIADILRNALFELQQASDLRYDDPGFIELQRQILCVLVDLEDAKERQTTPRPAGR